MNNTNSKQHTSRVRFSLFPYMARGFALCSNGRKSSTLLSNSIARVSLSISPKTLFASYLIQPRRPNFSRLFCNLASVPETVVESETKYNEIFSRRMAMAGLKPHHRIGNCTNRIEISMLACYQTQFFFLLTIDCVCVSSSFGSFRWA